MTVICKTLLLFLAAAIAALGQPTFTQCDINKDNALTVIDAQDIVNEGLGERLAADDLTGDGAVTVTDIQIVIDGILGIGCARDLVTPTFAITYFSVLNQAWSPAGTTSRSTATTPHSIRICSLAGGKPNSNRELVRPEALATNLPLPPVTDANGEFRLDSFPSILNPLEWFAVPADKQVRVVVDPSTSDERSIHQ